MNTGLENEKENLAKIKTKFLSEQLRNLANTILIEVGPQVKQPAGAAGFSLGEIEGFIPLEGVIDRQAELERQQKEVKRLQNFIANSEKKLANENFISKAPADVVGQVRETLAANQQKLESVLQITSNLQPTSHISSTIAAIHI